MFLAFYLFQRFCLYKRFFFNDCQLLDDEPDLYERVQDNIKNGLPVHLAVVDETWQTGHNLIIDGYKNDGFYHLNFGWGGPYDGWYKLPQELPYNLTVLEGVIVDIKNNNTGSDLKANGALYWTNARPKTTLYGNFSIANVGLPGSKINWKITTYPTWGSWSFDPTQGSDLSPENGPLTIKVSVDVPFRIKRNFNGYIKIADVNNDNNSCIVHVFLSTKLSREIPNFLDNSYQRNLFLLHLLRFLF